MYTEYPFKVVVVNNGGPDDDHIVQNIIDQTGYQQIEMLSPGENLGWMAANNRVLMDCVTPYFCVCNDDVTWIPDSRIFWRGLIGGLESNPKIGAIGPCSNFVAGAQSLFHLEADMMMETSLLIGFCCVFKTEAIVGIGGLDEDLPGGDDLDWSIRLRKAGWELHIDRSMYLHHHGQQTGRRVHGDDWDSEDSQERTNNALIRKHGMKTWYECFTGGWKATGAGHPELQDTEEKWYGAYAESHKSLGHEGINIGCGDSAYPNAVGIDESPRGANAAGGQKVSKAKTDIQAKADDMPFADNSKDFIIAAHILEHTLDPIATLKEWKRVLKTGGIMYMTLPNHEVLPSMIIDYTHVHAYTPPSLCNLLKLSGWDVEVCEASAMGTIRVVARKSDEIIGDGLQAAD
jgi:SAM-dependent methyltransferase